MASFTSNWLLLLLLAAQVILNSNGEASTAASTPATATLSALPITAPVTSPTTAPASSPITAPVTSPTTAPASSPITAPVTSHTAAPVTTSTVAPVTKRTAAPATITTGSPTGSVPDQPTPTPVSPKDALAQMILSTMKNGTNVCTEMYRAACGKYSVTNSNATADLKEEANKELVELVENLQTNRDAATYEWQKKVKIFYAACLKGSGSKPDETEVAKATAATLADLGGWPLLNDTKVGNSDYGEIVGNLYLNHGTLNIFAPKALSAENALGLSVAALGMPLADYQDPKKVFDYKKLIKKFANKLKDNYPGAQDPKDEDINDMVKFETDVASSILGSTGPATTGTVKEITANDNFNKLLSKSFFKALFPGVSETVLDALPVKIELDTTSLQSINTEIFLDSFEPAAYVDSVMWSFVRQKMGTYWNSKVNSAASNNNKSTCVRYLYETMPIAVERILLNKLIPKGTEIYYKTVETYIRDAFRSQIADDNELQDQSKSALYKRLNSLTINLGVPPDAFANPAKVSDYYDLLKITDADTWYEIQQKAEMFAIAEQLNSLVNRGESTYFPPPTNIDLFGAYNGNKNSVSLSAYSLHTPLFDPTYPFAAQFSGLGFQLARSIAQAFDFAATAGELTSRDKSAYDDVASCVTKQYNAFNEPIPVEGKRTLGQNLADSLALEVAGRAYTTYIEQQGKSAESLPGIGYTDLSLFYLIYGRTHCSSPERNDYDSIIQNSPVAPEEYRVKGSLSNQVLFYDQFQCKIGRTCAVWSTKGGISLKAGAISLLMALWLLRK